MNRFRGLAALIGLCVFAVSCGPVSCEGKSKIKPPKRVILLVIDALRADHVGAYGYPRPTTPNLDAIAAKGVLFKKAVAASSWTQPSMASVFTSAYPTVHHVIKAPEGEPAMSALSPAFTTLAEIFRDQGYATAAVSAQPWVSQLSGMDQGFQKFDLVSELTDEREAEKVMDGAIGWIVGLPADQSFFLYLHIMGPHWPYNPPPEFRGKFSGGRAAELDAIFAGAKPQQELEILTRHQERFLAGPDLLAELIARYDEDLSNADHQAGRLWAEIERRGLAEDTMFIIMSDHGEEFLDHGGFLHGFTLFLEQTDVPLIIFYPPLGAGLTVSTAVSLTDLLPTLARLIGAEVPREAQGNDLLPIIGGGKREPALSELLVKYRGRIKVSDAKRSLIYTPAHEGVKESSSYYDLLTDPREQTDVSASRPEEARELMDLLLDLEYRNTNLKVPPAADRPISPEVLQKLQALGYFNK